MLHHTYSGKKRNLFCCLHVHNVKSIRVVLGINEDKRILSDIYIRYMFFRSNYVPYTHMNCTTYLLLLKSSTNVIRYSLLCLYINKREKALCVKVRMSICVQIEFQTRVAVPQLPLTEILASDKMSV